jgi:long-chain acyl-CoA synthetase
MPDIPTVLGDVIERNARYFPGKTAVVFQERRISYAELASRTRKLANALHSGGLRRQGRFAILAQNCLEYFEAVGAAEMAGFIAVTLNWRLSVQELAQIVADSTPTVLIFDAQFRAQAESLRQHGGSLERFIVIGAATDWADSYEEVVAAAPDAPPLTRPQPDDGVYLIYTSGTTGRPKGVMLDHANISATAELIIGWFEMTPETRCLLVLPLFHVNGIMVSVVSPLLAGGSTFIAERFHAASFWATVEQVRPTFFSAVPTIYALLTSRPGAPPDTRSLRFVICGAAPMPRQLIGEFEQRFDAPVVEGYGLSECTVVCTLNPLHGTRKAGSVGAPVPGIEVGVADETDQLLPAGQPGEVVVRGPNVMRGYLGRPEESAQVLRGGWLHTGDVGRFDDDGYLTLVDRVKDLIIRGGENIYPKEIEDVLYTVPAVLEAAVVGQPDPVFGEQPVAFVTLRSGFDVMPEDLIEHCRQSLARYKVPREVYIEEMLPKNAVGKIAKPELRQRLQDASAPASGSRRST